MPLLGDLSGDIRLSAKLQRTQRNDKLPLLFFMQTSARTIVPTVQIRRTTVSCSCAERNQHTTQVKTWTMTAWMPHHWQATTPAFAAQHIHAVPQMQPQPHLTDNLCKATDTLCTTISPFVLANCQCAFKRRGWHAPYNNVSICSSKLSMRLQA